MNLLSSSLRPAAIGLAAVITASAATTASACPDWRLTGAQITASGADLWNPQSFQVVAGGNIDLAGCSMPGNGYVVTQPDFDFSFTDNSQHYDLEFRVSGTCDTVLLVNDAAGNWQFNDDSNGTFDPSIRLADAPAGGYDIWVGTFGPATCQATLTLETFPGAGQGQTPAQPQAMADPGNLTAYRGRTGETLTFTVTGAAQGSVWGSGLYTDDSSLARAAVHAGALQVGQTGTVTVRIEPGQQSYGGSAMNGVQSSNYGSWSGSYSFVGTAPAPAAMADPGDLTRFRGRTGETLTFTVTGSNDGSVWGSGLYTDDSRLARAVVHAGVLQVGQTGTVQVRIEAGQQSYAGSAMNGVQSSNYGPWTGSYSIVGAPQVQAPQAPAPQAPTPSK